MIREAKIDDIPRIVAMGKLFRESTPYSMFIGENSNRMAELAKTLIAGHGVLVSERDGQLTGMLGFLRYSHFISGDPLAGEVFWWVDPDRRGEGVKLLIEMERRAKQDGAKFVQMIAPSKKVAGFYGKMGYEYVEETWQKNL